MPSEIQLTLHGNSDGIDYHFYYLSLLFLQISPQHQHQDIRMTCSKEAKSRQIYVDAFFFLLTAISVMDIYRQLCLAGCHITDRAMWRVYHQHVDTHRP